MSSYDSPGTTPSPDTPAPSVPAAASETISARPSVVTTLPTTDVGRRFTVGDALAFGSGIFVLAFSFLPFVSYDDGLRGPIERSDYDTWFNAWEAETFMAPLTWFVVLAAVIGAALSATRYLRTRRVTLVSFTIEQLQLVFFLFSAVVLLGYAVSSKSVFFGTSYAQAIGGDLYENGIDFSAGGYLMLIFAILGTVGATLNLYNVGPTLFPRSSAPAKR